MIRIIDSIFFFRIDINYKLGEEKEWNVVKRFLHQRFVRGTPVKLLSLEQDEMNEIWPNIKVETRKGKILVEVWYVGNIFRVSCMLMNFHNDHGISKSSHFSLITQIARMQATEVYISSKHKSVFMHELVLHDSAYFISIFKSKFVWFHITQKSNVVIWLNYCCVNKNIRDTVCLFHVVNKIVDSTVLIIILSLLDCWTLLLAVI